MIPILIGLGAWFALSAVAALILGRAIQRNDRAEYTNLMVGRPDVPVSRRERASA